MTVPTDRVPQLIRRTKKNLDAINNVKQPGTAKVFEVTQLVNSCLAVIVHVHESKIEKSEDFDLPSAKASNWPDLSPTEDSVVTPLKWTEQMRLLRNGIAHGNIKFHPEESGKEITHVEIWNEYRNDKTWGTKISVADMRKMIEFIDDKFGQDG